jgi:hypothetical protein
MEDPRVSFVKINDGLHLGLNHPGPRFSQYLTPQVLPELVLVFVQ